MQMFTFTYVDEDNNVKPAVFFTQEYRTIEDLQKEHGDFSYISSHFVPCSELEVPMNIMLFEANPVPKKEEFPVLKKPEFQTETALKLTKKE